MIGAVSSVIAEAAQHIHFAVNHRIDPILEGTVIEFVVQRPATDGTQAESFNNVIYQAF